MKKLISTVLALGMAASLAACGSSAAATPASTADAVSAESAADTDLAYIQGKGKMTIGYTVYEPMNYTDADGNFTATPGIPPTSALLKASSFESNLWVEPIVFTSNLPVRLRSLYTQ